MPFLTRDASLPVGLGDTAYYALHYEKLTRVARNGFDELCPTQAPSTNELAIWTSHNGAQTRILAGWRVEAAAIHRGITLLQMLAEASGDTPGHYAPPDAC